MMQERSVVVANLRSGVSTLASSTLVSREESAQI